MTPRPPDLTGRLLQGIVQNVVADTGVGDGGGGVGLGGRWPLRRREDEARDWDDWALLTDDEKTVLKSVSLGVATVSLASTVMALFWFLRMRRKFRHDLIMLLIQADLLKSICFMLLPLATFVSGPIPSDAIFCQMSGFFLSVGIEAADVAVLLMALHTGLHIFLHSRSGADLGLYPYRRQAYAVWVIVPIVLSTLAFIHTPTGYVNTGRMCYLPFEPIWPRLLLSWIPRYIVFVTIMVTYVYIYFYVSVLIKRFREAVGAEAEDVARRTASVPPTPPIEYHGLIPPTPSTRRNSKPDTGHKKRLDSISTMGTLKPASSTHVELESGETGRQSRSPIRWRWTTFGGSGSGPDERPAESDAESTHSDRRPILEPLRIPEEAYASPSHRPSVSTTAEPALPHPETSTPPTPSRYFWRRPIRESQTPGIPTAVTLLSALRRAPHRPSLESTNSSTPIVLSPIVLDMSGVTRTRDKIRRNLRLLFIYPLIYMLLWAVPFFSHVLKLRDPQDPASFGVLVVSLISLCIQGTVNAWVFSLREKPWRHNKRGGEMRFPGIGNIGPGGRRRARVGRTREEMSADRRIARSRREGELAERRGTRGLALRDAQIVRQGREWWDVERGRDRTARQDWV